jgi:hypothetical protein
MRLPLLQEGPNRLRGRGLMRIDRLHAKPIHLLSDGGRNEPPFLSTDFLRFDFMSRLVQTPCFKFFN